MKILGTGLTGLVGSRISELLQDNYTFDNLSRQTGADITSAESMLRTVSRSDGNTVLHLAAKADVDACEKDKVLKEKGEAWQINVEGTRNVLAACEKTGKKLIFISTDFVFDGEHMPDGGHTETDSPNPINWYAQTKYAAELLVQKANIPWIIARISYPYRAAFERNDFMRAMLSRLQNGKPVAAITDHVFSPTFIDDIAIALDHLITNNATGIYHVTGSGMISPYDAACMLAKTFDLHTSLIKKTTRKEYFSEKAPRPFQLGMNNDKIKKLGVEMKTFHDGLQEVKMQINLSS